MTDFQKTIKQRKYRKLLMIIAFVAMVAVIALTLRLSGRGLREGLPSSTLKSYVTIEIRCDSLSHNPQSRSDKALEEYIPEDGVILPETSYGIVPDETTVFDVLDGVCKENDIHIEYSYTPGYNGYYVEGINYIYQFSAGKYSGWLYSVDGEDPGYGADKLTLAGGESIIWYYTVDYTE